MNTGETPREGPLTVRKLRAGMVGMGMIFDETYRPFLERAHRDGIYDRRFGLLELDLHAVFPCGAV